jgi:hypothetical protein
MLNFLRGLREPAARKKHEALEISIATWEKKRDGTDPRDIVIGVNECALCKEFFRRTEDYCSGCPIRKKTDRILCNGSPYSIAEHFLRRWKRYSDDDSRQNWVMAAQEMIDFMKDLRETNGDRDGREPEQKNKIVSEEIAAGGIVSTAQQKFCVDCVHYARIVSEARGRTRHECHVLKKIEDAGYDLVTGQKKPPLVSGVQECEWMRAGGSLCGPDGVHFEKRTES